LRIAVNKALWKTAENLVGQAICGGQRNNAVFQVRQTLAKAGAVVAILAGKSAIVQRQGNLSTQRFGLGGRRWM